MAGQGEDLVDVDPYDDGSFPEYRWRQAPEGLATRRQLRAMGLRPGGHDPVAQMTCRSGKRVAYLYRVDLAVAKLPMTLPKEAALDKAMAARQTCPRCRRRYVACLPLKRSGPAWNATTAPQLTPAATPLTRPSTR